MMVPARHAAFVAALSAAVILGAGCAKESTSVIATVSAETTVPPILILRTVVMRPADLSRTAMAERSSPYASDAADRPGPFVFPLELAVTADESWVGSVVLTVEGLDWDTHAVTALGSTSASIVAQQKTTASLTLTLPIGGGGGDGGTD